MNKCFAFMCALTASIFFMINAGNTAVKPEAKMKSLIVYYSFTGKTETAAKALAGSMGSELLKIEDMQKVSVFKAYFWGAPAARKGQTWPIKPINVDVSKYDIIFVGAPLWWGGAAPEINTFIDGMNFSGKSVVVFVTMAGTSPDTALKALAQRVESRGGKVIQSFSIKTGGMLKDDQIAARAKEIAGRKWE